MAVMSGHSRLVYRRGSLRERWASASWTPAADAVALMTHALGFLPPPSAMQEVQNERAGACHSNRRCQLVLHVPLPSRIWFNNGLTKDGTEAI